MSGVFRLAAGGPAEMQMFCHGAQVPGFPRDLASDCNCYYLSVYNETYIGRQVSCLNSLRVLLCAGRVLGLARPQIGDLCSTILDDKKPPFLREKASEVRNMLEMSVAPTLGTRNIRRLTGLPSRSYRRIRSCPSEKRFGWRSYEIDGHNFAQTIDTVEQPREESSP